MPSSASASASSSSSAASSSPVCSSSSVPTTRLEPGALAAEFLGALRLVPDGRILEFPQHLGQALAAAVVVKETP